MPTLYWTFLYIQKTNLQMLESSIKMHQNTRSALLNFLLQQISIFLENLSRSTTIRARGATYFFGGVKMETEYLKKPTP